MQVMFYSACGGSTTGRQNVADRRYCIGRGLAAIRGKPDRAHTPFLRHVLARLAEDVLREARGSGSTFPNITADRLHAQLIALPPLGEQKKIAAVLSSVDEVIEATQAVIDQLQVVKKAMMSELLTRGLPGRHKRFKQTEIGVLPASWDVRRAGDLCSVITKGATPAAQTRDTGEIPFLKVYNIAPEGMIDFTYQPTFIPRTVHETELARSRVAPGDVLMNIVGPPLGKIAVVSNEFGPANINQAIAVFRPHAIEPQYLEACFRAEHLFAWAKTRAKRTSTQLNLTLELCREYPMPVPPEDERRQIISVLSVQAERLRSEAASLKQLRVAKPALMSVLLTGEVRVNPDRDST